MIHETCWRTTLMAVLAGAVVACGSGGSPTAGIDRTGSPVVASAFGTVTAFGSIVVNGVRYDTASASFTVDGQPASQADLAVGDVVLVRGTLNSGGLTGIANAVTFDDSVEGMITSIDPVTNSLIVLEQIVLTNVNTSFDDSISTASLEGLSAGDTIEVSGLVKSTGEIAATRIELKPAGEFELTGLVSSLDTPNERLNINALIVDYSAASVEGFPTGSPVDGDLVEIRGASVTPGGELTATRVELKGNSLSASSGDHAEVEGFITRFASPADFDVSGVPVTTNGQTTYDNGSVADLGLNVKVEVEGDLDGNGVVLADRVDIRRDQVIRMSSLVDSVTGNSLVVLGATIRTDSLTRYEDKSAQALRFLTVADLTPGDYVEVRGEEFPAGSGEILAARLERDDFDPDAILQGVVETVSEPSFSLLGVTVDTNGGTVFRDLDDSVLDSTDFFLGLDAGDLVKVKGLEVTNQGIAAEEVELEAE